LRVSLAILGLFSWLPFDPGGRFLKLFDFKEALLVAGTLRFFKIWNFFSFGTDFCLALLSWRLPFDDLEPALLLTTVEELCDVSLFNLALVLTIFFLNPSVLS
jgi:hypothetical protein